MAATAVTSSCRTAADFRLSPKPPPSHKLFPLSKQLLCSYRITLPQISSQSALISTLIPLSVSSPETNVIEEEAEESGTPPDDEMSLDSGSLPPLTYITCHILVFHIFVSWLILPQEFSFWNCAPGLGFLLLVLIGEFLRHYQDWINWQYEKWIQINTTPEWLFLDCLQRRYIPLLAPFCYSFNFGYKCLHFNFLALI